MIEACIVAPTASGKSALALALAERFDCRIFSIDSLSIYKEIDIASAKPTKVELAQIKHYGVDVYRPDEKSDVTKIMELYLEAKTACLRDQKGLLIVGGSLFFLKSMIEGLSPAIAPSPEAKALIQKEFSKTDRAYRFLCAIDARYAATISENDAFRIGRGLQIYLTTGERPNEYFRKHKKEGVLGKVLLFEIGTDKAQLNERIKKRTAKMLKDGLIDEVCYLEQKYGRDHMFAKAIGIKEVLAYLDGFLKKEELPEKITTATSQYAKRQRTFAMTQLNPDFKGSLKEVENNLIKLFQNS